MTIIITTHVIKARVERVKDMVQASQERVDMDLAQSMALAQSMVAQSMVAQSMVAQSMVAQSMAQASQERVKALVQASQERHPLPPPATTPLRNHQQWWKQSSVYVKSLHGNSSWAPVYVIAAL